jgi:hypothetical protein
MTLPKRHLIASGIAALLLIGCESARFAGRSTIASAPTQRPVSVAPLEPAQPAIPPSGPITTEPLPPPSVPGLSNPASPPAPATQPGSVTPLPTIPAGGPNSDPTAPTTPRLQTAAVTPASQPNLQQPNPPPATPSPAPPHATASRSNLTGTWSARDAAGGSCRVTLSSAPALDLFKASAASCPNRDLARVNAWEYRDGEIYLYSAGAVVARLQAQGSRSASGALIRSGAPVSMSR